jgi:hypothetical protein
VEKESGIQIRAGNFSPFFGVGVEQEEEKDDCAQDQNSQGDRCVIFNKKGIYRKKCDKGGCDGLFGQAVRPEISGWCFVVHYISFR